MDWFQCITGFPETDYASTQARLRVEEGRLISAHSNRRYEVGLLETPSLAELRHRTAAIVRSRARLQVITADVRKLHADTGSAGALFQVASQFNLLEMVDSEVTPEDGVTSYQTDHTQGPACALAAGAATIYRNYLVPLTGGLGQTRERQIDCLADIGGALGNADGRLWKMRNGYARFTASGVREVNAQLAALGDSAREELKGRLRIGLHWNVDVTDLGPECHRVSQAFCSALPVAYNASPHDPSWEPFGRLVLEAAYEATFRAAALNREATGNELLFLTSLGGGAFGNKNEWIHAAMRMALEGVGGGEVRVVTRGGGEGELRALYAPP